jgi:tRNA A37 threonylcarbamoyladenosine modification protein TsaB
LQKASPKYSLLVISIASPLQIGVYCDDYLIETLQSDQKTSSILPSMISDVLDRYPISRMIYANGPGSYMAIKLTYIVLKTIEIVRGIVLQGCSAFAFNDCKPVKAIGNLYFIKEKETIITKKFEQAVDQKFFLPLGLHELSVEENAVPSYVLPAV